MLDEAKNAAEFNDYLRNVVYKFYTQTNLPVPKPEFIIRGYWTMVSHMHLWKTQRMEMTKLIRPLCVFKG